MARFRVPYTVHVPGFLEVEAKHSDAAYEIVRHNTPHADLVANGEIGGGEVFTGEVEEVE